MFRSCTSAFSKQPVTARGALAVLNVDGSSRAISRNTIQDSYLHASSTNLVVVLQSKQSRRSPRAGPAQSSCLCRPEDIRAPPQYLPYLNHLRLQAELLRIQASPDASR